MFLEVGKAVGAASFFTLTTTEILQAHRHVLISYIAVKKFLEAITKRKLRNKIRSQSHIDSVVHREFPNWFRHEVPFGSTCHSNELQWLACRPLAQARRFQAYNINGFKFRTISREEGMKTQNSEIYVTSDTRSYASKRDVNVAVGGVLYYRRLVDIIEINYSGQFTIVLFKSRWFVEKMIEASSFSSLDHATCFARQLWFKESRIQSWLDAFSGQSHLYRAIGHAPASMMRELFQWDRRYRAKFGFKFITSTETWCSQKIVDEVKACYENTFVVELDITSWEEFKLIEHGLERLWDKASEELEEVVLDSMEKEDVVSSDGSDEADSAGRNGSMLSYDLNKMPEENEYPYSGMSPEKKNAWNLAMWATRLLLEIVLVGKFIILELRECDI
ncbi:hypothetical protein AHAS_Ahas09G0208700 [Arachis hypogaea]